MKIRMALASVVLALTVAACTPCVQSNGPAPATTTTTTTNPTQCLIPEGCVSEEHCPTGNVADCPIAGDPTQIVTGRN